MKNKTTHTIKETAQFIRRGVFTLLVGIIYCASLSAQSEQDTIMAHFSLQEKIPQEKLYLHLDKPFYGAGEKIWFKGYLVNGMTHQDNAQSNFIITEIINRSDSIIERRKIRRDSLGFANTFALPPTLPEGDYYLRGYSNWMQNQDPGFFYSRNLKIGNAIDNTILSSIEYQKVDDMNYIAKIKFYGNAQEIFGNTNIRYRAYENGKMRDKGKRKTDESGMVSIPLSNLNTIAARRVEVEFDDPRYIYKKTFYLPPFTQDFDVTFFPEGGELLSVRSQSVAFKAQGADGLSRKIEGFLFNSKGDTLSPFRSEHDGMGVLTMNPLNGDSYYAMITSSDGITKRFDLPIVATKGVLLSMTHFRQEIRFNVQKTKEMEWPQKLFLIAHTRGKLSILQPVNPEKPYGRMNDSLFQAGITHFMIIDQRGNALSERLVFIPDITPHQWQIQPNKASYGKREKVSLLISAKDQNSKPIEGTFSISVTDRRSVQPDSLADNILSNLLLTSDLKGTIENPGYYFLNQDPKTLRTLDFVMMTHGWRKHQHKNVFEAPNFNFANYIEKGQTISGRIKGFFGGNVKKGPIYLLAPKQEIFVSAITNDNGEFMVNTSFKDSTSFIIQARTKSGFAGVDIEVDALKYPDTFHKNPFHNETTTYMNDYLLNTRDQYYMEGGMRVYNLKEVVIKANRAKPSSGSIYTSGINTYTIEGERLERMGGISARDAVIRLPGVTTKNGSEIHIRNNPEQAVIVIDDVVFENDDSILTNILASEMSSLSVLRGTDAVILGPRAAGGAIVITLKDPRTVPSAPARGVVTYRPLGYADNVEFYHPTYDTPEKTNDQRSDLRTTIYWNPELRLDNEGKATIEYYSPDNTAPQDIIIEGVDKNGKVCRFTLTINKP